MDRPEQLHGNLPAVVEFAATVKGAGTKREQDVRWREATVEVRLSHALVKGIEAFIEVVKVDPQTVEELMKIGQQKFAICANCWPKPTWTCEKRIAAA